MGPTAQDFAAAFGLGGTDTAINAADVNGVTLAAIQALAEENEALALQNQALEERLAALEALVAELVSDG
jgi:regulator of replication initiation timing